MVGSRRAEGSWIGTLTPLLKFAIGVVGASVVVWTLANLNKGFEITIDKDGKAQIEVRPDDSFDTVLGNALAKDGRLVDAILWGRQYYKITDEKVIDALESLNASAPQSEKIVHGLRKMLWDLNGPFAVPGTLRGADGRMVSALEDLDKALETSDSNEANVFLATLWNLMIDQQSIFKPRMFSASVEVAGRVPHGTPKNVVYACPGSALVGGRVIHLFTKHGSLIMEVKQEPSVFNCTGPALTLEKMLVGGVSAVAVNQTAFNQLVRSKSVPEVAPAQVEALFVVYPRNLVGALQTQGGQQ
jgi:hypothetical protein